VKRFAFLALLSAFLALPGCTSAQAQADVLAIETDAEGAFTLAAGAAHAAANAAEADPVLWAKAQALAQKALTKAGVSSATASKVVTALNAKDMNALADAAGQGAVEAAALKAATVKSP